MKSSIVFKIGMFATVASLMLTGVAFAAHDANDAFLTGVTTLVDCPPPYKFAGGHCFLTVPNTSGVAGFILLINQFTNWFVAAVVFLGLFYGVWGAFDIITAGGEDKKVQDGKKKLFWAIGGIILAVLVRVIITIVVDFVGTAG